MKLKTLMLSAMVLAPSATQAAPPEVFWRAVHQVETSGRVGRILGDGGRSLGPLQISLAYWKDSRVPGRYSDCTGLAYSRRVATAYLKRYAPRAWRSSDCQVLARIHNGGPRGHRKKSTVTYWVKVRRAMQ